MHRTIVVDAGKNFQAAALEWFPKYGLRRIDALLITHAHADGVCSIFCTSEKSLNLRPAINGLDDLRGTFICASSTTGYLLYSRLDSE
jgi:Cft2 family RNA processing exonuclease